MQNEITENMILAVSTPSWGIVITIAICFILPFILLILVLKYQSTLEQVDERFNKKIGRIIVPVKYVGWIGLIAYIICVSILRIIFLEMFGFGGGLGMVLALLISVPIGLNVTKITREQSLF